MADTVVNTLYPPLIETFQPAFLYNEQVPITFSISAFNSISDIKKVHVSIVDQRNNSNVLKGYQATKQQSDGTNSIKAQYCIVNGILIAEMPEFIDSITKTQIGLFQYDPMNNIYAINLNPEWLDRGADVTNPYWNNNQYYQVQIRFDNYEDDLPTDDLTLSQYLLNERVHFSEWSSITLIKPILKPIIFINQFDGLKDGVKPQTYPGNYHISGSISFEKKEGLDGLSYPEIERLQAYKIIASIEENLITKEIFNSDWIYARQNILKEEQTTIDCLLNLRDAKNVNEVKITIYIRTNNGYIWSNDYKVLINEYTNPFKVKTVRWNDASDKEIINQFFTQLQTNDPRYNNIKNWIEDDSLSDEEKATNVINVMTDTEWKLYGNIVNVNQEDGIAKIRFSAQCEQGITNNGVIYFRRSCSKDNFESWDLIYRYEYTNIDQKINISFDDLTIGSLYRYKYSVQFCMLDNDTNQEIWGTLYDSAEVYPKFYDMLLMRQDKQIAIRYNGQISSWKPTVNRQKIDTLGGRYPKFVENATMNYKTYAISGLISAEEDFNRKFLNEFDGEYDENNKFNFYYQDDIQKYDEEFNTKYIIRNDTVADNEYGYNPKRTTQISKNEYLNSFNKNIENTLYPTKITKTTTNENTIHKREKITEWLQPYDLYPQDHWYWEREFREQLVNWLNDGEPKLYRSMPEGNIAVILTDINLTPNTQLGRRLYNFNATMYEVADGYDLEQLDNLGVIDIPKIDSVFINGTMTDGEIAPGDQAANIGISKSFIGYGTISSNNSQDWINGDRNNKNNVVYDNVDLWNDMSIKEKLNKEYEGINKDYNVLSNSLILTNVDIQFTSEPHYFTKTINNMSGKEEWKVTSETTNWLGYILTIKQKNESEQDIFINQKGFYHIPAPTEISSIKLNTFAEEDGSQISQKLNFYYTCNYRIITSEDSGVSPASFEKHIIGQYTNDTIPLDTDITNLIYQKHKKDYYVNQNDKIVKDGTIYLRKIDGMLLDLTPYTYLEYKYNKNDANSSSMLIGETGIFDNFKDWPIDYLVIHGRRLTPINSYPYHIEEYNYYKDETITQTLPDGYSSIEYEWLKWNDEALNNFNVYINGQEFKDIIKNWDYVDDEYKKEEIYGFLTPYQITDPKINTVYSFVKEINNQNNSITVKLYHKIYYIDRQWYLIDIDENDIGIAKVPIYGMINYHGDLVKER